MSELDNLRTEPKVKDYDIKTLKAKSNTMVAKALAAMEKALDSGELSTKDQAALGLKIVQNHIILLDKVEKQDFIKLNKNNLMLKNNKLLAETAGITDGGYQRMQDEATAPTLDMGWDYIAEGDTTLS